MAPRGDDQGPQGAVADPFSLRANAPISVVQAARASLRQPTRPMTPSDGVRQLFARDSDFAQARPPSSHGLHGSKLFFEGGPKLNIARLDARPDSAAAGALGTRRSILSQAPGGEGLLAGRNSFGSMQDRPSWQGHTGVLAGAGLLERKGSHGRATPAETVQALKASLAAVELGLKPSHQLCDIAMQGEEPSGWAAAAAYPDPRRSHEGAQVLDLQADQHSSSDDDQEGPAATAAFGRQGWSTAGSAARFSDDGERQDVRTWAGPRPSSARQWAATGAAQAAASRQVEVDADSRALVAWRADAEAALQQLGAATGALAASAGPEGRAAAMAQVMAACKALLAAVVTARKQPCASQWLNSSSATYQDSQGCFLSMREAITEHVFRLLDSNVPEVLLRASSIVLRVVKSRTPLLQAGRLLYRLSKDAANDPLFRREALLEPMLRTVHAMVATAGRSLGGAAAHQHTQQQASVQGQGPEPAPPPAHMYEPMLYYAGTLKNVTLDAESQRAVVRAGGLHVLCGALRAMAAHAEGQARGTPGPGAASAGPAQVAVQVTGALRNLAVMLEHAPAFLAAGALIVFKTVLRQLGGSRDLALNVGRVLSKLSLDAGVLAALEADPEWPALLVGLLRDHQSDPPVMLRAAFVLGNLTTTSETARREVAGLPGCLDLLVSALCSYADPRPGAGAAGGPPPSGAGGREDCCVKLLRLVANLGISPEVGPCLAARPPLASCLLRILEAHDYEGASEELVLNAVCAVTNLSFWDGPDNQVLALEPGRLLRRVTPLLLADSEEAVAEAARALGNLSRGAAARAALVQCRALEALALLLDHNSWEVLHSVCGTLVNFSADASQQGALVGLAVPPRLVDVLARCTASLSAAHSAAADLNETQVDTAGVVGKALFNLCTAVGCRQVAGVQGLAEVELRALGRALCTLLAASAALPPGVAQVLQRLQSVLD